LRLGDWRQGASPGREPNQKQGSVPQHEGASLPKSAKTAGIERGKVAATDKVRANIGLAATGTFGVMRKFCAFSPPIAAAGC
jgi:hypothetical protein